MRLNITRVNPAGNITLLVDGDVRRADYASLAVLLMEKYKAEQVAYIAPCTDADIGIEMMGGEFCGNALRSAGYFHAVRHRISEVKVRISGCSRPMTVTCDIAGSTAYTEMPVPSRFDAIDGLPTAVFDGIAHGITTDANADEGFAREVTTRMCEKFGVSAAGIMFLDHGFMRPAVYVRNTDTLFFENSCASGSAAAAAILSRGCADGTYTHTLEQPGGVIIARARVRSGEIAALSIGGNISLDESFEFIL